MLTDPSTRLLAAPPSRPPWSAARRDDYFPPPARSVIVGPPVGNGRVAFVQRLDAPVAPAAKAPTAPEVRLSLFGHRPGGRNEEMLLQTDLRRCDLWNGDFDETLKTLVLFNGWTVTRIERREIAAGSA